MCVFVFLRLGFESPLNNVIDCFLFAGGVRRKRRNG